MKATKIIHLLVIALALTVVGTGCQKRVLNPTPIKKPDQIIRDQQPFDAPPVNLTDPNPTDITGSKPMNPADWMTDPNRHLVNSTALAAHIVHFDYDSSVVKGNEQANVAAVADYMKSHSEVGLRIDGHCDERGTEDYNNSLGERRATALRDAVIALGVDPNKVITQTFGENKPVAQGQDEASYRQNRRGEFMVLEPK